MAGYTVISDVGGYLVELLRRGMVPEPIQRADAISLFAPDSDHVLSLALYGTEILNRSFPEGASLPLSLKYILIVNSAASAESKAAAEHRIMGKALSVLCESPVIRKENSFFSSGDTPAEITLENLTIDERVKVCEHICGAFRTSVFLSVSPVFIETGFALKNVRVLNG